MTRNIMHPPHNQPADARNQRQADIRVEADILLREIAFVLKMTERIRGEMEVDEEAYTPALS